MTRKTLFLILFLLLSPPAWATDYTQDVACQGAWLFTEGSGATVADSSQNTNTGNLTGDYSWASMSGTNAPTYADYMVDLVGAADYMQAGSDSSLEFANFTITIWVNFDVLINSNSYNSVLSKESAVDSKGFGLLVYGVAGDALGQPQLWIGDGAFAGITDSTDRLATGTWAFLCGLYNGTSAKLYHNGVQSGSTLTDGFLPHTTENLTFGASAQNENMRNVNGKISESSFFSDVLDSTDINDIMDNGLQPAAPPAVVPTQYYYRFLMQGGS